MAQRANVDDVGILRIDDDAADLPRVVQADVLPGLSAVGGFVDSVARAESGANVGFAGAGIDDVGIRRRNFQCADRGDGLPIEYRLPGHAGVDRLPDAAVDRAEVKRGSVARHAGDCNGAAAAKRADQSPLQPAEELRRNCLGGQRRCSEIVQQKQ